MTRVGDIIKIPLTNERYAYGQYVFKDPKNGPLLKIFNLITDKAEVNFDELTELDSLFPPIITGISRAVSVGMWQVVGKRPITNFVYPQFISSLWDNKTNRVINWFLWDGREYIKIGGELPEEYKKLEYLIVWSPYDVVHRIETGEYVYPYGDLIRYNKFSAR
jgi:hypothetical protein